MRTLPLVLGLLLAASPVLAAKLPRAVVNDTKDAILQAQVPRAIQRRAFATLERAQRLDRRGAIVSATSGTRTAGPSVVVTQRSGESAHVSFTSAILAGVPFWGSRHGIRLGSTGPDGVLTVTTVSPSSAGPVEDVVTSAGTRESYLLDRRGARLTPIPRLLALELIDDFDRAMNR